MGRSLYTQPGSEIARCWCAVRAKSINRRRSSRPHLTQTAALRGGLRRSSRRGRGGRGVEGAVLASLRADHGVEPAGEFRQLALEDLLIVLEADLGVVERP